MRAKKGLSGLDHYKKKGLKPLLVNVTAEVHQTLSDIAKEDGRSLQVVARAVLNQAAKDRKGTLSAVRAFIKATSQDD